MKYFIYILISLILVQCKSNEKKHSSSSEKKDIKKELIGNALTTINQEENRLNIKFDFEPIDIINYDVNGDNKNDIIKVERIKDWSDPGDFHRIVISLSGQKEYSFFNVDGWVQLGDYELQFVNNFVDGSLVSSKYLTLHKASKKDILLFCFGYVYASQPGLLTITNLTNPSPQLIFNEDYFLHQIDDVDNDGIKDIILSKLDKENLQNEVNLKTYKLIGGWYQSE